MSVRILLSESEAFSPKALDRLRAEGEVTVADLDREGLTAALRDTSVLWVRLRHRIDREILDSAPLLEAVVSPTTGLNHLDTKEMERRGIHLLSLRGEVDFLRNVRATAELTVGLMLALLRKIPAAASHVEQGGWTRDLFRGGELYEKTVGIVGYGRLGRLVARYLQAFDANVLATDPYVDRSTVDAGVRLMPLEQLLEQSDIVSLHVSLSETTTGLFDGSCFARMKPGSLFINTARGELVDENALIQYLESGHLAGAGLDVLAGEDSAGMGHHSLVRLAANRQNLIITPHIGGCTLESMHKTEEFLAGKLCDFLATRHLVPAGTERI